MTEWYPPWYSYGIYRFIREQNIWAIDMRAYFEKGKWPREPKKYETEIFDQVIKEWIKVRVESSYIGITGPMQFKPEASFVKPATIWSEITQRLTLTRTDGKLLIKEIESMERPDYDGLEYPESRWAVDYISLWDFADRPGYSQWRKRRIYYEKTGR